MSTAAIRAGACCLITALIWVSTSCAFTIERQPRHRHVPLSSSSSDAWMQSLRARQLELDSSKSELQSRWRNFRCKSTIPLSFPDWVRRIDVDYPLVAAGSSSGNVHVANLESGKSIGSSFHQEDEPHLEDLAEIMRILFGSFDGGGTIAIAMRKSLICSAGRQGSVQIFRNNPDSPELISQGSMQVLEGVLVTCLELDDDFLWVGTVDGRLQAYVYDSQDLPLAMQMKPAREWNLGSSILSLSLSPELGYGMVSTKKGMVHLFSLEDNEASIVTDWMPPFDSNERQSSNVYVLSTQLVAHNETGCTMACGCSDGSIYLQPLNYENGILNEDSPIKSLPASAESVYAKHSGPAKVLASPIPGIMLSGGQDGSMRVWNIDDDDSHVLYQFVGYKVWLGSLWTDGNRLVSDGADNTVVMHEFMDPIDEDAGGSND